jgi:uncharacterized protein YjiS (DUF1127 family)
MPAVTVFSSPTSVRPSGDLPVLRLWRHRILARRALAALHPEQIRDAGLDPWRLRAEIRKPFWRA